VERLGLIVKAHFYDRNDAYQLSTSASTSGQKLREVI
jgi:hypothetical protein